MMIGHGRQAHQDHASKAREQRGHNDDLDEDLDNIPQEIDLKMMKILRTTLPMNNWDTECILLMLFTLGVAAFSIMLDSDKENK